MANRFVLVLMLFFPTALMAQEKFLKKKVSVDCQSCSVEMALDRIGNAANVKFSYDASLLSASGTFRIQKKNIEIASLLKEILGKDILPREVGNHIILVRNIKTAGEKKEFSELRITGLILDASSGRPVTDATIYEAENRNSTISSHEGKYLIRIPTGRKIRSLTFCKSGYADTVIFIRQVEDQRWDIALRPLAGKLRKMQKITALLPNDHSDTLKLVNWIIPREVMVNARNLKVGTPRPFQVSLIPYVGTSWRVSGSVTNRVSVNILAGYTAGLSGVEVGGLLNITRNDISGVQISGLCNIVGRNMDGVQIATLVNVARRHNSGIQVAGLLNYATTVTGLQLGLINVSNSVERGIPIGLFSYVQEGYHLFEFSANEIFYGNIAFKSGTRTFYNFVQLGIGSDFKLQGSYGIGTLFTLKKAWSMNMDASAGFVYHPSGTTWHGMLLKFNPSLEYRFKKHLAVFGGPAYNFFLWSKGQPSATPRGLSNYDFYFKSTENASIQMWIGGVVGVRF